MDSKIIWTKCFIIVICGINFVLGSVNLAFKKPAIHSSNYISGSGQILYTADQSVDENTSDVFGTPESPAGTCSHTRATNDPQPVYWEVDLGQNSIVSRVLIQYRRDRSDRMNGYSIIFSNVSLAFGKGCYTDIFPGQPLTTELHNCLVQGRYARYENNIGFAEICNFEAYGCPVNFYGPNCTRTCSLNCLQQPCEPENGACINGCVSGWKLPLCNEVCNSGTFGRSCSQSCFCRLGTCDRVTGLCPPGGCQAGWTGPHCNQTCPTGKFGLGCTSVCNCNVPGCHPIYGTCNSGVCLPGYFTDSCSQRCPSNTFGQNCSNTCPGACIGSQTCNHVSGICDNGCADGWLGPYCNVSCSTGFYGFNCSIECGNCLNRTNCDHRNGDCPSFLCDLGFFGRDCKTLTRDVQSSGGFSMSTLVIILLALVVMATVVVAVLKRKKIAKKTRQLRTRYDELRNARQQDKIKLTLSNGSDIVYNNTQPQITIVENELEGLDNKAFQKDDAPVFSNSDDKEILTGMNIRVEDLEDVIEKKYKKIFEEEYKQLPDGAQFPTTVGADPNNKVKNRFLNIYPYDKNRVILPEIKGVGHSDYINASYIDGLDKENAYIAAQGPKKSTIMDFWRMVWREKVVKIVMVTNLVEATKNKCEKYWPDLNKSLAVSHLVIENKKETTYAAFITRELKITSKKSEKERTVYQFHFTRWPDHGTPDPSQLVHFNSRIELYKTPETSPIVVHCSAGIGRTGTFIALHELKKHGSRSGSVDVFQFAKLMRDGRMNMIQTLEQYIFLHEALLEALNEFKTAYLTEEFADIKKELLEDGRPKNQTLLWNQFETLKSEKPVFNANDYSHALNDKNRHKNRNTDIVAHDKYRTFLISNPSSDTDYINAVTVPSYTSLNGFITTQIPLSETIEDFWRMVYDHECKCIIVLDHIQSDTHMTPPEHEFMKFSSFIVYNERVFPRSKDITDIDIVLSPISKEKDIKLKMYITTVESSVALPENKEHFVCLCEILLDQLKVSGNTSPTVIMCRNGATLCGLFITMTTTAQRIQMDKDMNIFEVVKTIQERQPRFVDTFEQYRYVHMLIDDFMESNQLYVNV